MKFSKKEAIKFGFEKVKKHFWLVVLIALVVLGINSLQPFLQSLPFLQNGSTPANITIALISILFAIIGIIVQIGLIRVSVEFAKAKTPAVTDLFYDKPFIPYILTVIVSGAIVFFGLILFIIPAIIFGLKLQFAPYLVVDKRMGVVDAIYTSWKMTKGQVWNLFLFAFLLALLNILGAIIFGIGLLLTIPTSAIAIAHVYLKLSK